MRVSFTGFKMEAIRIRVFRIKRNIVFLHVNLTNAFMSLQTIIENAWQDRSLLQDMNTQEAIRAVLEDLDKGRVRVAEPEGDGWKVNEWVKKAVLMYFPIQTMETIKVGPFEFHDKIALKGNYAELGVRVVPHAIARYGSFVAKGVILMPSYVNIGAFVDEGTMVDTWATVGSCAQVGKNVHLSGGVGLGGVLEPLQANPTIIEDNCFIGARSEVVEGVIVEENSVISMGVYIGQSTPIFNRETGETTFGRVPAGSVVVSGNLPKKTKDGKDYSMYAAIIV